MKKIVYCAVLSLVFCGFSFGRGTPVKPGSQPTDALQKQQIEALTGAAPETVNIQGPTTDGTENTEPFVIAVYGQSQTSDSSGQVSTRYGEGAIDNAYRYVYSSGTRITQLSWDQAAGNWGCYTAAADKLREILPANRKIIVAIQNYGGQPISTLRSDYGVVRYSTPGFNTWDSFTNTVDLALTTNSWSKVDAVLFAHGESGSSPATAAQYQTDEEFIRDEFRSLYGSNCVWITFGLGPGYGPAQFSVDSYVNQAKKSMAATDGNTIFIPMHDAQVTDWASNMHYTPEWQEIMGERFVDALFEQTPFTTSKREGVFKTLKTKTLQVGETSTDNINRVCPIDLVFHYPFENSISDTWDSTTLTTNGCSLVSGNSINGDSKKSLFLSMYESATAAAPIDMNSGEFSFVAYLSAYHYNTNTSTTANGRLLGDSSDKFRLVHTTSKKIGLYVNGVWLSYDITGASELLYADDTGDEYIALGVRRKQDGGNGIWKIDYRGSSQTFTNAEALTFGSDIQIGKGSTTWTNNIWCMDFAGFDRWISDAEMNNIRTNMLNEISVFQY